MKDIVIIGAGGFAREVHFLLKEINKVSKEWNFLGYVSPEPSESHYFGDDELLKAYEKPLNLVIGIGNPVLIQKISNEYQHFKHFTFPNLFHPNTICDWESAEFGKGNIVCANCIFTVNQRIGSFNIFNLAGTYGHEIVIGDGNVFNPGVNCSGEVSFGNFNLIGTNAAILQQISIGQNNKIGAGAVLTKSFENDLTLVGIPAKILNR